MTSGCKDKEIARLLHAYELGLLSDEDRERVELHVHQCESCFQELRETEQASRLLKHDSQLNRSIEAMVQESAAAGELRHPSRARRIVLSVGAIAAVVLILVLKNWRVDIQTDETVMAGMNRLSILPFTNLAQPSDSTGLGEIVADLLITGLSQSESLQVVSSQYAFDLVNQIRTSGAVAGVNLSEAVARRANARWALDGSITQVKPVVILTAQIVDVSSGTIKSTAQVSLADTQTVFAAIDQLSNKVRQALLSSSDASKPSGRSVADMTTSSPDAYREYIRGLDFYRKFYFAEAEVHFRRALKLDSVFAMPHYYLSMIVPLSERQIYIEKAVKYSVRASERDRFLIDSWAARMAGDQVKALDILGRFVERYKDEKEPLLRLGVDEYNYGYYSKALKHLLMALTLDSSNILAWNQLAYTYDRLGDFKNAIQAIDRSIALSPNEANPYDSRGEIYSRNGRLDEAIASFRLALQMKPDFYASLVALAPLYVFKGEYDRADSCLAELAKSTRVSDQRTATMYRCYIAAYQGHFREALAQFSAAARADSIAGYRQATPHRLYWKATILEACGKTTEALETMERCLAVTGQDLSELNRQRAYYIGLLARAGRVKDAIQKAGLFRMTLDSAGFDQLPYRISMALIALSGPRPDSAFSYLEDQLDQISGVHDRVIYGRACLEAHLPEKAIAVIGKADSSFAPVRLFWGIESVKLHYYLGQAYEQSHRPTEAADEYRKFLAIWNTADPGIKEVSEARNRLQRLEDR